MVPGVGIVLAVVVSSTAPLELLVDCWRFAPAGQMECCCRWVDRLRNRRPAFDIMVLLVVVGVCWGVRLR